MAKEIRRAINWCLRKQGIDGAIPLELRDGVYVFDLKENSVAGATAPNKSLAPLEGDEPADASDSPFGGLVVRP